jgi:hypothetical protein
MAQRQTHYPLSTEERRDRTEEDDTDTRKEKWVLLARRCPVNETASMCPPGRLERARLRSAAAAAAEAEAAEL